MRSLLSSPLDWLARATNSFGFWVLSWFGMIVFAGIITAVLSGCSPVMAATAVTPGDGVVIVPWGDWLVGLLEPAGALVVAMIMWALRRLPSSIYLYLQMMRAEQLVQRAVDYALSATAGAVAGKQLSIGVTSEVLEAAAEYAVAHAPGLMKTIGGADLFKQKALARLNVAEDVSARSLGFTGTF